MRRRLAAGLALGLGIWFAPAAAGQSAPATKPGIVPTVAPIHPSRARVRGKRAIDIPQEAKDAGHNGGVTWVAAIGADGVLTGLTLEKSSGSPAIDAAAKAWAEKAEYTPATDASGRTIAGSVQVHLSYEPWDGDNGGGLAAYRCRELVRDADWFAAAHADRQHIFWLENAYTSLPSLRLMQQGKLARPAEREVLRARAAKDWQKLLGRCRKAPDRMMLDLVEDRDFYRSLVESF